MHGSIRRGGFFDRHPILVPASIFFVCWIPYLIIFFRKMISFGDLGGAYPYEGAPYWILFVIQLGVCVISHSLTIRTIVRLYARKWLIYGSIAFYALSPAWGLMTAADIRHPLFAAVFCVFTSSAVFALFSRKTNWWLWVQMGFGALSVCLLRNSGVWAIIPALIAIFAWKVFLWRRGERLGDDDKAVVSLRFMAGSSRKKKESLWADACASFLVLSAVGLLFILANAAGFGLPLGEPSYGVGDLIASSDGLVETVGINLAGSSDIAGIIPLAEIEHNSLFEGIAVAVSQFFYAQQCFPLVDVTFSWVAYLLLFAGFLVFAIAKTIRLPKWDVRSLIIALPMVILISFMTFTPTDCTLRYIMPILAAQPMFFGTLIPHIDTEKALDV